MSGEVLFAQGDLLEYTRPVAGLQGHEHPVTVRGIVLGFAISRNHQTQNLETRVWVYEGAEQFRDPEEVEPGVTVTEGRIDKERQVVIWKARDLIRFENFRVVSEGNHPTEMLNFSTAMDRRDE